MKKTRKKRRKKICLALVPWRSVLAEKMFNTIFKILVLSIVCIFVAYGWFYQGQNVGARDISVKAQSMMAIDISIDSGETWASNVSVDFDDGYIFSNEVTSDGINFYKAGKKNVDGYPTTLVPAVKNEDYYECKILFKSSDSANIYLDKESFVLPSIGIENPASLMNSNHVIRESPMGNFSRDFIAGAVRMAFIENDFIDGEFIEQSVPKYIWAPNKGYQIVFNNGTYYALMDSTEEQPYNYLRPTSSGFEEAPLSNIVEEINASYPEQQSFGDIPLTTIRNSGSTSDVKAVTVRIWVEGNDREAVNGLKGGLFKINLSFVGLDNEL